MITDRDARMALSWVFDAGDPGLTEQLPQSTPREVLSRTVAGEFGPGAQRRARAVDLVAMAETARRCRARFVVPGDDQWPRAVDDLTSCEPIQGRGGAPVGLWVRGPGDPAELTSRSVAIVGARACSPYGEQVAVDLAAGLAEAGVTVVSGGAYGIDVAAHRGALAEAGATIAVLACGVDVPYPRGNADVLERIAAEHLLISEVPPGSTPTRIRFLSRNRLIAALTAGSVMVEAAARSGARNTLGWAQALGRHCMAVPGSVNSALSVGCHDVLRSHQAVLVSRAAEVLELTAPMGEHLDSQRRGRVRRIDTLDPVLAGVFEVLPARGYRTAGEVSLACGLAMPDSLGALALLEENGLAVPHEGGWRAVPQS
ncbi:MAG: DNA-processing protein DprA [Propionibacteriales bacterium]|nr:DNA-processing protein DprA [Propionibacteriales bacterium]